MDNNNYPFSLFFQFVLGKQPKIKMVIKKDFHFWEGPFLFHSINASLQILLRLLGGWLLCHQSLLLLRPF